MREILFRGKRKDNGEWVKGSFWDEIPGELGGIAQYGSCVFHHVDLTTVGQFTGLTDKNGKKIFEGDILQIAKTADDFGCYYYPPLGYPVNVVVKWDFCAWMWETLCEDKRYISFPDAWCKFECEVIGNIHDNPELLKVCDLV